MVSNYDRIKESLHEIIFESNTPAGKAFDVTLIIMILSNSILIIAESVDYIRNTYSLLISTLGWIFIVVFTLEFILRVWIAKKKKSYIFSFFGIIDLLAILPAFIGFFLPQVRFFTVIRSFRLLRLFSILKMGRYVNESGQLMRALKASKPKITVFLFTILFIIIMVGSMMYVIEGPQHGFDSIPESMYWAIVTVSTVGYGDISPQTPIGKLIASLLMIIAYGIIAVPTGIISQELVRTASTVTNENVKSCPECGKVAYTENDRFCAGCGSLL